MSEVVEQKKRAKRGDVHQVESVKDGRVWAYDWMEPLSKGKRKRHRRSGFKSKAAAETALSVIKVRVEQRRVGIEPPKKIEQTTLNDAMERYIELLKSRWMVERGPSYESRATGQINAMRKFVVLIGKDRFVSSVIEDDLAAYTKHEVERGLKPASVKRRLVAVRAALRHAGKTREDLAVYRVPDMPRRLPVTRRTRMLEDKEIVDIATVLRNPKLLRHQKSFDAYDFLVVSVATGARIGELLSLKWTDVDFDRSTIKIYASKTTKTRTLTVPAAVKILCGRKEAKRGGEELIWTCKDHVVRDAFRAASRILEIPYGQREADKRAWSVHDLRHTCLTHLLVAGADIVTVRDWAGHASVQQTEAYIHPSMRVGQKAVDESSRLVSLATSER